MQRIEVPGWTPEADAVYVAGSPGGNAAKTAGRLTSAEFTLPNDVQQLTLRYKVSDAGSGLFLELLRDPTYSTVVILNGGSPLTGTIGQWHSFKLAVSAYRNESVKLRVRPQLGAVTVDDVGALEQAVPGWTLTTLSTAIADGSDGDGNYVTSYTGGTIELVSSAVDVGLVDKANNVDARSYTLRYMVGPQTGASVVVYWTNSDGTTQTAYQDAQNPGTVKWGRVIIWDTMGVRGTLQVKATGGTRVYAIGDNVARQQRAEPFSRSVGIRIDTSTGSFGTEEVDLTIEGGPLPLTFARYYHGHSDRVGPLGYRWTYSFETFLGVYVDNDVAVVFGSGKEEFFDWRPLEGAYKATDARVKSTLTKLANNKYEYKTKENLTYLFEEDGDLERITDANGNFVALTRDGNGRLTSVADPGGRTITLGYDGNGRLATLTGPGSVVVTYTYDANGDLVTVDKPGNQRTTYEYSRHRLTKISKRTGPDLANATMTTVVVNTLDSVNRVITQTDAQNRTLQLAYQTPSAGVTRVTDALNNVTDYYFDKWARTIYVDNTTTDDTTFVFDSAGNLQKVVNGLNQQTQLGYNGDADATTFTDPLGNPSTVTYNPMHLPLTFVDANNGTWTFTYDIKGNVLTKTDPLLHTWTYTYDTRGNRLTETSPSGRVWTNTYDAQNNLTSRKDPLNDTWTYTYDGRGHKQTETTPRGHTTTWT